METQIPRPYTAASKARLILEVLALAVVLLLPAIALPTIVLGSSGLRLPGPRINVAQAAVPTTTHLSFDILPVKPGGPSDNFPAYVATSPTTLPANTLVTVTIRNFDVGDDALPASSPFLRVQGTAGGAASADGKIYTKLGANHVSHTFTIMQIGLNVPIPGDPVGDANNVTVTFSFRTPAKAGAYTFQCFVPCGTGTSGFQGPMADMGYMKGP
jgi:hypothetical protein